MIPETEAIFETDLMAKQHPELILEQAREVLMLRSLHALREINNLRAAAESSSSRALELEEETRRDALTGVYTGPISINSWRTNSTTPPATSGR